MSAETDKHTEEMYLKLVAGWTVEETVKHILYWRAKSVDLFWEVERDKTVIHLRKRINAMHRKLKATREAALQYKRGRDFDRLAKAMEKDIADLHAMTQPTE